MGSHLVYWAHQMEDGKSSTDCDRELDALRHRVALLERIEADARQAQEHLLAKQQELAAKNQELREIQRRLEAYRDRYVDLYDFAPVGYATLDEEGYIQEINLAGAKLLGGQLDELVGYPFADYVAAPDRPAIFEHLRKCCRENQEVVSELSLVTKDGREIAVQLRSVGITALEHEGTFCKTAITDITDRKRAEEAIHEERNLLRTLLDNLPDRVYVKDVEGRFVAANLATARTMGATSPNDLLGKTDFDFYPPERASEYRADEQQIIRSGQPLVNKDEPHVESAGNPRVVLTTKVPLKDRQDKVIGLVGISRDITERKQSEEALVRQQRFLEAVLDSIEAGIVACDANGVLTLFNRATREFHGLPQEPLPAEQWAEHYDLYLPDGRTRMQMEDVPLFRALRGEHLHNVEMVIAPKHGPVRTILASGQPLHNSGGQKTGAVAAMHDITERKRDEQAILRLNEQLQVANRDLEAFTSSVCHDLRKPLHIIGGFSQIFLEEYAGRLDETAKDYLDRIGKGVRQMGALIDDLMKLSRVSRSEIRRATVDLSGMAQAILEELRKGQPERDVEFIVAEGLNAYGDPHLLRVVLENLVGNAWKFTSKHAKARIEVSATVQDRQRVYFVRDDGAGFDMKLAQKLFGVFQRMHSAVEFDGTGVGLATVERIIRAHGGRAWAEAEVERGATVFFTLPEAGEGFADSTGKQG